MVTHKVSTTTPVSVWGEWSPLVAACGSYAKLCGWRFVRADFMNMNRVRALGSEPQSPGNDDLRMAQEQAMPMALEYADRVKACLEASKCGAEPPRLLTEFQACQRLVASEAVYNSMVATVTAVGLGAPSTERAASTAPAVEDYETARWRPCAAADDTDDSDAFSYQDMSQPIEVIAARLRRYHERLTGNAESWDERQRRLLHASFIVEFGLEHGLPEVSDATSENTLKEFLQRLGEWEGGQSSAVVRSLVLDSIPEGPAKRLRQKIDDHWSDWFDQNRTAAIVGGAVLGGLLGVIVAGATLAVAGAGRVRGGRR
jgi:hypothetical protein